MQNEYINACAPRRLFMSMVGFICVVSLPRFIQLRSSNIHFSPKKKKNFPYILSFDVQIKNPQCSVYRRIIFEPNHLPFIASNKTLITINKDKFLCKVVINKVFFNFLTTAKRFLFKG